MRNQGEVSIQEKDQRSSPKTERSKKEDRERSNDYAPRQRVKAAYPLSKLHAADLSLLQQRPPSPEKEGHSRIEWQNVDSAFSQCHAKEKKDSSEPYQRIEKMILCQAVTPLVEKNPKAREKQAPR